MVARVAAGAALLTAVVVLAVLLLTSGSSYTLNLRFQDSGGLVSGNLVMIGPAQVGSVTSIGLTQNGLAEVQISLNSTAAPVHEGTVARVFENSLSGSANRYVVLEPGATSAPEIPSGGMIGLDQTHSFVNLDQVFDAFNPLTRLGLRNFIQGQAASIQGRALQAHQTLLYFAPALSSTSDVTKELVRDEPAFDGLLVQGAKAISLLSSRSQELTQLIANGNVATGSGGAIDTTSTIVTVSKSTFQSNSVTAFSNVVTTALGGATATLGGKLTITGSKFSGNTPGRSGEFGQKDATVIVNSSTIDKKRFATTYVLGPNGFVRKP